MTKEEFNNYINSDEFSCRICKLNCSDGKLNCSEFEISDEAWEKCSCQTEEAETISEYKDHHMFLTTTIFPNAKSPFEMGFLVRMVAKGINLHNKSLHDRKAIAESLEQCRERVSEMEEQKDDFLEEICDVLGFEITATQDQIVTEIFKLKNKTGVKK